MPSKSHSDHEAEPAIAERDVVTRSGRGTL